MTNPPATQPSFGFTPGDTVIVTGAGSGIGQATARNAAAMGLRVAAWDVNGDTAAATAAQITNAGAEAVAVTCDVGSDEQVAAALDASQSLRPARYLVNNAGPASANPLDFEFALTLSVGSMRRVAYAWLDGGRPAGAALVNVSSLAGNLVATEPDWYPTSKAAIMGWTRHLAAFRAEEVRSNAVAPGMTDTPRLAGFKASEVGQRVLGRIPFHRLATPDEISWAILFLLSPLASYINGALLVVDGGWTVTQ